jgi:acyl carrier protein
VTTIEDFVALVRDQLGLSVTVDDIGQGFDQLAGWDSLLLLTLVTALERETGQRISLPDVLEATSLEHIYGLAVAR